jgi:hypothetical protein
MPKKSGKRSKRPYLGSRGSGSTSGSNSEASAGSVGIDNGAAASEITDPLALTSSTSLPDAHSPSAERQSGVPASSIESELLAEAEARLADRELLLDSREDDLRAREAAIAEREASAIDGFKALEAAARREWLEEQERRLAAVRYEITQQAQQRADSIVEEAHRVANEYREALRTRVLETEKADLEKITLARETLVADEQRVALEKRGLERLHEEVDENLEYIAKEKKRLIEKEAALAARERACSEETVARLLAEMTSLENRSAVLQAENHDLWRKVHEADRKFLALSGSPKAVAEENLRLRAKIEEYEGLLERYPTEPELADLRRRADAGYEYKAKHDDLVARVDDLERTRLQLQLNRQEAERFRQERDHYKLVNEYLAEQRDELQAMLGKLKDEKVQAFANLTKIDEEGKVAVAPETDWDGKDLAALARRVRGWMANLRRRDRPTSATTDESTLFAHFYDEHTIRAFIASMAASRLIIIQGISGTGKTSLPEYFARGVGGHSKRIEVQSSWRDKADLLGFYNSFFRVFNESEFSRGLYEAGTPKYRNRPYFILLDEMNLSRVEYYFADLLSIMEGAPEDRSVELLGHDPTGGNLPRGLRERNGVVRLPIPPNVWFVGTANTDESTYEITRKVYDRAQVIQLDQPFSDHNVKREAKVELDVNDFLASTRNASVMWDADARKEVMTCFGDIGKELDDRFRVGYGRRLLDQLALFVPTYARSGGQLGAGLDHFVARKLLWQLQNRTDPNVKAGLEEVRDVVKLSFDLHGLGEPSTSLGMLEHEISRFAR